MERVIGRELWPYDEILYFLFIIINFFVEENWSFTRWEKSPGLAPTCATDLQRRQIQDAEGRMTRKSWDHRNGQVYAFKKDCLNNLKIFIR